MVVYHTQFVFTYTNRWMGKAVRYTTASLMEVFKGEKTLAIIEMVDKGNALSLFSMTYT